MTIATVDLNLIIPITLIQNKYPGGWKKCLEDHKQLIGVTVWFDKHLFRFGSKESYEIAEKLKQLELIGFSIVEQRKGEKYWCDVCIYSTRKRDSIKCEWLSEFVAPLCKEPAGVYLKGQEPGDELIGPTSKRMVLAKRRIVESQFRFLAMWYFIFLCVLAYLFYFIRDNWL